MVIGVFFGVVSERYKKRIFKKLRLSSLIVLTVYSNIMIAYFFLHLQMHLKGEETTPF